MARHSLRGGDDSHGALQFDWGFPISRTLRGHLQVFDGYGESLIDYDHRATYVGLGISLPGMVLSATRHAAAQRGRRMSASQP